MFIKDLIKEFIYECEIRKYSPRTIKGYRNNNLLLANYIEKEFGIFNIDEVAHVHIKHYFSFLTQKKLSETYINGLLKCFRAFYKYCFGEGYISINPTLKVSWQREPKTLIRTFTDKEVSDMLKAFDYSTFLNARNKTIIAFFVDTAMRNLELCSILCSDVKEQTIIIKGKGNKERYIGISPLLKKSMIKYERIRETYFKDKNLKYDNYFLSQNGLPLTKEAMEHIVTKAGIEAGVRAEIRCSPHTIRHYSAQAQLRNGLDVYSLSRLLGHENIMITKRYLQSIEDKDIIEMSIKTSPLMNL